MDCLPEEYMCLLENVTRNDMIAIRRDKISCTGANETSVGQMVGTFVVVTPCECIWRGAKD